MKSTKTKPNKLLKKEHFWHLGRITFWFFTGAGLSIFVIVNIVFFGYKQIYKDKVYPGVLVNGIDFGGKSQYEVEQFFRSQNKRIKNSNFIFNYQGKTATVSASEIGLGYDEKLIAVQAFSIARNKNNFSNLSIMIQTTLNGVFLPAAYNYSEEKLLKKLEPLTKDIEKKPVEALFTFENGKVLAFRPSKNGQTLDKDYLLKTIKDKAFTVVNSKKSENIFLTLKTKTVEPNITTDKVNNLGIKEMIGYGTSLFAHSIPGRIHNVTLAASRINGILVPPGQTFSFNKTIGDISAFTGYKQAYVIQNGRTVLGDGGGVCQVSTTLFRAVLSAGLPIVERQAHAYRVGYYEQDSAPGLDATVFDPKPDFRFKNDTGNYILIQSFTDLANLRLTFILYGTKDGREVAMGKPVITKQTPAPEPIYQDDPTLPKGVEKQVDYAASGANVYFTRTVKKDGKTIIDETFYSNYRAWPAVFLRGTKEG